MGLRELLRLAKGKTQGGVSDGNDDDELEGTYSGAEFAPRSKTLARVLVCLTERRPAVLMRRVE